RVRYRMLETLREFGRLRLQGPGERRALARRHRDHYLRLIERAVAEWFGPAQAVWFVRLRLERAHLRAAMEFCLGEPSEAETGLRMAILLFDPLWMPNAFYSEGRYWLDRLLEATPGPTAVRAEALCTDAHLAFMQGDPTAGELRLGEGRALAEKLDDSRILAWASLIAGIASHQSGDHARAAVMLEEAVDGLAAAAGEGIALVVGLFSLGAAVGYLGDVERAERLLERSLAIAERHGESWIRSWVLNVYAIQAWQRGDNARAASAARESLRVGRGFDDGLAIGTSLEALGWILQGEGRHAAATRLLGAAMGVCRTAGIDALWMVQHREFHERCVNALRARMGERAFDRALRQGGRLTPDDAIAEALGEPADAGGTEDRGEEPQEAAVPAASPLTRRESEIAELVSQGMSNREISSALVISLRTAEGHVERILTKLGFNSRAQIAAWVIARKAGGQDGRDRGRAAPPPHPH
ncbi:LuxR C-terminal-related transcriptional regulator, partial [Microbispora sp. NPDC046973]|uniref:LuxR C-terminal-related transcriptional regulator n=1 Tax=Microbispora sp. NPDC046973 TaxID=3155022 RepID=UPI0033D77DFC